MPLIWLELIGVLNSKENKTFNAENLFLSSSFLPSFHPSQKHQQKELINAIDLFWSAVCLFHFSE